MALRARILGDQRRAGAPRLARAIEEVLGDLALGSARVEVVVEDTPDIPGAGDATEMRLSTNPGMVPGPLSKVASGGELSRVMLALRLVLSGGPPTMIFDEVDAGIGGAAALSVGQALGSLGLHHQVIVVTHLAQVAAFADAQVLVHKDAEAGATISTTNALDDDQRIIELSRMLSGSPDSDVAHLHASELLADASELRSGPAGPARDGGSGTRAVAR